MAWQDIRGVLFPLYTAKLDGESERVGDWRGRPLFRRAANNVLWLVDPEEAMPGWRHVGCRPRWSAIGKGRWVRNDASMHKRGERRWWGPRHHVRIWHADGYAIGQAHHEIWVGRLPRRHHVTSLDAGRDAVVEAAREAGLRVSYHDVPSDGRGWDGRVAVIHR